MLVKSYHLSIETTSRTDLLDITDQVTDCLRQSGVEAGAAVVFVPGSTGSVTTIEYESGALQDLARAIERLAPESIPYDHDRRWGDGNGYSHVRAALLKPGISIPVISGRLTLGTWQQIVLIDFDNRPRQRRVVVQIMGERAD